MPAAPGESPPLAERYRRFAEREARGRSPLYERLALGVSADRELLELLERLPPDRRQPNLLFATVQYLGPDRAVFLVGQGPERLADPTAPGSSGSTGDRPRALTGDPGLPWAFTNSTMRFCVV